MVKKKHSIDEVKPGMELASALTTDSGRFALGEGTVLTANLIERLRAWGVDSMDIRVTVQVKEKKQVTLSPHQEVIAKEYNETVHELKRAFETVRFFKQVPLHEMQNLAESRLEPFINSTGILNHLHMVHRRDDYTFHHSINVGILCGVIGRWLGYSGQEWKDLVLAGLLHDIGKTQIALEILRKPGKLSELEMDTMKNHTTRGYNLVKSMTLPQNVLFGILQHHERADGSGYPLRVAGDKIHPFAKVVAVADVYDAITSDTAYRKRKHPFEAVEALHQEMYDKLDPNICTVFLNNVRDYFIGNVVELSDGREAEVVYLNGIVAARPVVRTEEGEFIDLEKKKNISISRLLRA